MLDPATFVSRCDRRVARYGWPHSGLVLLIETLKAGVVVDSRDHDPCNRQLFADVAMSIVN